MFYDEEKATIVAYQAEIDENPEYEHIEKIIDQNPNIWAKLNKGNNIIIFDVLKTYEDGSERIEGDDLYVDTLCICTMQIMYDYSAATTAWSEKSYPEQIKEIITEYRELGYTIPDLETLDIPQVLRDNEWINYAIVAVIVETYLGTCEEYGIKAEEEEEEFDDRKGTGTVKLSFNEESKEQKKMLVEKTINAARADGIDAGFEEGVSEYNHESPEFILTFPSVTKMQWKKYCDMSSGIGIL
ncbi:hypothetical protein [Methanosarcina sp.]|uniref:hypothetical protein n=1 Tax=Methanosarcina sp. TaxID=2213 RepID=UPI003BB587EF